MIYASCSGRCQLIDSLFHGLRTLLKNNCVDYPKMDHLYLDVYERNFTKDQEYQHTADAIRLTFGQQGSYLWSLPDDANVLRNEYLVGKKVDNREFDVVIYADIYHVEQTGQQVYLDETSKIEEQYFWRKVSASYSKSKIGFLDGLDVHYSQHKKTMKVENHSNNF